MKRFWRVAEACAAPGGYVIKLDDKHLCLPDGELVLPNAGLASAVAAEWSHARETFVPDDLPFTRLANTACHRVRAHRGSIVTQIAAYGGNDLLCYRAGRETELASWQASIWQPWLDWVERETGAHLVSTSGLAPITQQPAALVKLRSPLDAMTDYQLAGLGVLVPALGSLILGLAVAMAALPAARACELAMVEELWQEQRWGEDAETRTRRGKIIADVAAAARFMVLCAP